MTAPDPYEATLQHIGLIARKRERLLAAQLDAERQLLHRAASDYVAGHLSLADLWELNQRYRASINYISMAGRPAPATLWNASMPITHGSLPHVVRNLPNEDGYWSGEHPGKPDDPRPMYGQSVVYVLFDDANAPCYVGSTEKLSPRLTAHSRDKKFSRWVAYPCADREAAYQLEDRLLKEHKPYLNRKAGR
jgi:predicted GIY-YIG superfamily endonuclease